MCTFACSVLIKVALVRAAAHGGMRTVLTYSKVLLFSITFTFYLHRSPRAARRRRKSEDARRKEGGAVNTPAQTFKSKCTDTLHRVCVGCRAFVLPACA